MTDLADIARRVQAGEIPKRFAREHVFDAQALMIARERNCAELRQMRSISRAGQPSRAIQIQAEKLHREFHCSPECRKAPSRFNMEDFE